MIAQQLKSSILQMAVQGKLVPQDPNDGEMFWYFVISFMAATGARVSELIQIKVEHIKLGYLDLYSKGGKLRRIYIPKALKEKMKPYHGLQKKIRKTALFFITDLVNALQPGEYRDSLKSLLLSIILIPLLFIRTHSDTGLQKSFLERHNDMPFLPILWGMRA